MWQVILPRFSSTWRQPPPWSSPFFLSHCVPSLDRYNAGIRSGRATNERTRMSHISLPRSLAHSPRDVASFGLLIFRRPRKHRSYHRPPLFIHNSGIIRHVFPLQQRWSSYSVRYDHKIFVHICYIDELLWYEFGPFVTRCLSGFLVYCVPRERGKEEGPFFGRLPTSLSPFRNCNGAMHAEMVPWSARNRP